MIMISENIVAWYWLVTFMVFVYWFMMFYQDQSTPINDLKSWFFLFIASLLWPITLPLARWELSHKASKKNASKKYSELNF